MPGKKAPRVTPGGAQCPKSNSPASTKLMNNQAKVFAVMLHPSMWNIYGFHCSDGDNWPEDHEKCMIETRKIIDKCQVYSFCEITPEGETFGSEYSETYKNYKPLISKNFKLLKLISSSDIWLSFKKIFGVANE